METYINGYPTDPDKRIIPVTGDRVLIVNVPHDHNFKELYRLISDHELNNNNKGCLNNNLLGTYEHRLSYGFNVRHTDTYESWTPEHLRGKRFTAGFSLYVPFFDGRLIHDQFSFSGCSNHCLLTDIDFIKNAPAPFWRFKNKFREAGNGEIYFLDVNYFQVDFRRLQR